jgi:hypothetical protein
MKLPGEEHAIVELRDYCLNPLHPGGRHKARVFASALGLTGLDAEFLREELLRVARVGDAVAGDIDGYGKRYTIDFGLAWDSRRAMVRSTWNVLSNRGV